MPISYTFWDAAVQQGVESRTNMVATVASVQLSHNSLEEEDME
jgi:hypothetical protein